MTTNIPKADGGPVLSIDTTTETLQIAVWHGERVLGDYIDAPAEPTLGVGPNRKHSARLMPAIGQVLEQANLTMAQVSALVVVTGPGSFTGIRTGITCARTLAQVVGMPVLAVNRFELMAWWLVQQGKAAIGQPVVGLQDARRSRVYTATMVVTTAGSIDVVAPPVCVAIDELMIPDKAAVVGELPATVKAAVVDTVLPEDIVLHTPTLVSHNVVKQALALLNKSLLDATHPWVTPWQAVVPLYIQPPSITLPKPRPVLG